MKYIITEEQSERYVKRIFDYLDSHMTPFEGWKSTEEYLDEINDQAGEDFLHFVESEGSGEDPHMWYSECDNGNYSEPFKEGTCPLVTIPSSKSDALEAFFGDRWKPVFIEWFKSNTGLPLINVETQSW